jgi:GGDEF domain-containing protein
MSSPERGERGIFPPLAVDGNIDVLTGLDAPEIFYKFLAQSLARSSRHNEDLTILVRFQVIADHAQLVSLGRESLDFEVAALADFLKKRTRAEEKLVRIGEATFLLLAQAANQSGIDAMVRRFANSLADFRSHHRGENASVDYEGNHPQRLFDVEVSAFPLQNDESLLDFLERVGV